MISIFMVAGLIALVSGAGLLVRGASRLAADCGISSLVVGLTIVAFGTSAPEMAVSVSSAFLGRPDIAVGNAVGSNILNVLLILGLSALIVPLIVDQRLVRIDVPVMIVVSLVVWLFSVDLRIGRLEGLTLFAGLFSYVVWCIVVGRRESPALIREYDEAFGKDKYGGHASSMAGRFRVVNFVWNVFLIVAGLALLIAGAGWLMDGVTEFARRLGVSELVIGLTIVAAGTSLPELATSIVAALHGERDIAVGNVVGSNIFNLLGVLGLSAVFAPDGVTVAEQAFRFDIPVMVIVAVACLPVFFTGHVIERWEGGLFTAYFVAYTTALVLIATNNNALPSFRLVLFGFAVPLTTITLAVVTHRTFTRQRDKTIATHPPGHPP